MPESILTPPFSAAKIGTKFVVVYEVVRPVENGEMARDIDGVPTPINNLRENKWWARPLPVGPIKHPELLACFEPANDLALMQKLAELVELLSNRTFPN